MTRKLALVLASCLGLVHQAAFALGLGEIDVDSALNQPFSATIDLRNTEALERNEIIATLASVEDFERVGVERFFFLSDLSFDTHLSGPEGPVLRVSSNQPITEPFVNFVVEVLWPSGRLLKEFTVLLDPPTYAARPIAAPQLPAASVAASSSSGTRVDAPAAPVASSTGTGALVGDTYGVTDRNDTLWNIALEVRPDSSFSVHQTMLALLRLNPEAFIGNNINQLKAGYVLRVPDAAEIRRLELADAIVQVGEQNDRWRSGLDRAPLDAREAVAETRGDGRSGGELRLVSGTADSSATGTRQTGQASGAGARNSSAAPSAEDGALRSELASAQSQLEGVRRQTTTLRNELQSSAAEREALERQVQVKDEQIARLQQALAQQLEQQSAAPPPTAAAPAPSSTAASSGLFGFSWLVIGGAVGGLIVLGVAALLVLRRLSSGGDDDEDAVFAEEDVQRSIDETQMMPALTAADLASAGAGAEEEEGEDVLAEADVYMAYGNFSEAAASLSAALDSDPNRADIRLKLLEVYVEQGDVDGFNAQAQALADIADEATIAEADRLAARLPGATSSSGEVTSGDAVAAAPRDGGDGGVSLDFDLALDDSGDGDAPADLDSLDIDLDLGDDDASDAGSDDDGGLDFDLDLDVDDDGDDADVDLDLDGLEIAGDDPAAAADEDDFALSLEGDDEDDGDLADIDFEIESSDDADADKTDDDGGLDFEIDELDDGDAAPEISSESDDDFADRTVIMGGDDLEIALEDDSEGDSDDDGFDFDIDDLAAPDDAAPAAEPELSLEDDELSLDGDDELSLESDNELSLDDGDELSLEDDGELSLDAGDELSLEDDGELTLDDGDDDGLDFGLDDDDDDDATVLLGDAGGDSDLDFELDEEFDFGDESDADEITTKLELARAYVDMGDEDGAKEILEEVVRDGDEGQQKEAGDLLAQIG